MAVTYRIKPGERIVYLITTGESFFAEWRDAMLSVLSDPSFKRGMSFLSDKRNLTDVPDSELASAAADFLREHSEELGECLWAAVTSRHVTYGMMRMYSVTTQAKGVTYMPFMNYEEARRWLLSAG